MTCFGQYYNQNKCNKYGKCDKPLHKINFNIPLIVKSPAGLNLSHNFLTVV